MGFIFSLSLLEDNQRIKGKVAWSFLIINCLIGKYVKKEATFSSAGICGGIDSGSVRKSRSTSFSSSLLHYSEKDTGVWK